MLFLRQDLVPHVPEDLPRTVFLLLPQNQVLATEMDLLPAPGRVAFEIRRFNRDVAHHLEALRIERTGSR